MTDTRIESESLAEATKLLEAAQHGERLELFDRFCASAGHAGWLLQRRSGIGGSDVAAILGLNPYRSAIDIWGDKLGLTPPEEENEFMLMGKLLEPVALQRYQMAHPEIMVCRGLPPFRSTDHYWQIVNVDAFGHPAGVGSPDRVIEAKARGKDMAQEYGPDHTDMVPTADLCQGAYYMPVLDVDRCDYATIINTHKFRQHTAYRDLDMEHNLLAHVEKFWQQNVLGHLRPDPDGSKSFTRYLAGQFEKTTGEIVEMHDPDLERTLAALQICKQFAKMAEHAKPLLEQTLQAAILDADGIMVGGQKITWKYDKCGRVSTTKLIGMLRERAGITADEYMKIEEECRGSAPRRFLSPRLTKTANPITGDSFDEITETVAALKPGR